MESTFKQHLPCPNCGSRNNLAEYNDHSWCFGCGFYIPGYKSMSVADIRKQIDYDNNKEKKRRAVNLPSDYHCPVVNEAALAWLRKYGITDDEIKRYRIGWTEQGIGIETKHGLWNACPRALVYPAFDLCGNLLMVQLRSLEPKDFYTGGFPESVYWSTAFDSHGSNGIVLVEDFISAIRVGRSMEAMPLWGSNMSLNQIRRLSDHYEHLVLWLDFDKAGRAAQLRVKASPYFKTVRMVVTQLDPKETNDAEIAANLGVVS